GGIQPACGCDHGSHGVVVGVGDADVAGIQAVVDVVAAGRGAGDNRVGDVAIVHAVVNSGDGDALGCVPIRRRKRQISDRDSALGGVAGGDWDNDVCGRLAAQLHREGGRAAGLGGGQPAGRRDGDAGRVVVRVGDRDVAGVEPAVGAVAAGRRAGGD